MTRPSTSGQGRNPRPCILCGGVKSDHAMAVTHPYIGVKRWRPLRSHRRKQAEVAVEVNRRLARYGWEDVWPVPPVSSHRRHFDHVHIWRGES